MREVVGPTSEIKIFSEPLGVVFFDPDVSLRFIDWRRNSIFHATLRHDPFRSTLI